MNLGGQSLHFLEVLGHAFLSVSVGETHGAGLSRSFIDSRKILLFYFTTSLTALLVFTGLQLHFSGGRGRDWLLEMSSLITLVAAAIRADLEL